MLVLSSGGEAEHAAEHFLAAIESIRGVSHSPARSMALAGSLANLGAVRSQQADLDAAAMAFAQAAKILREWPDANPRLLVSVYKQFALVREREDDADQARSLYKSAALVCEENSPQCDDELAQVEFSLGRLAMSAKDPRVAEPHLLRSLDFAERVADTPDLYGPANTADGDSPEVRRLRAALAVADCKASLGACYQLMERVDMCHRYYVEAIDELERLHTEGRRHEALVDAGGRHVPAHASALTAVHEALSARFVEIATDWIHVAGAFARASPAEHGHLIAANSALVERVLAADLKDHSEDLDKDVV